MEFRKLTGQCLRAFSKFGIMFLQGLLARTFLEAIHLWNTERLNGSTMKKDLGLLQ